MDTSTSEIIELHPKRKLQGVITVPADKSVSHRSIMCASLAKGESVVYNFLTGEDCISTAQCFKNLGVDIKFENDRVYIKSEGLRQFDGVLNVNNSGTTMRMLTGILASQNMTSQIDGDQSIQNRPLKRVTEPLKLMGANFEFLNKDGFCPVKVFGTKLNGIRYKMPILSAQVKSAILFAGLSANSNSEVIEISKTRDHTERMLKLFGAKINVSENKITITPSVLKPQNLTVPGDISSAAFFIAASLITKDSLLKIENVGINPTRGSVIDIFRRMGGDINIENYKDGFEPTCDLIVKSSKLKGVEICGEEAAIAIDELPIIAAVATQCEGTTAIKNAGELKVKESNRIDTVFSELTKCGADIKKQDDGFIISGKTQIKPANFFSYNDHRIAMTCAVLSLIADGFCTLQNYKCVNVSYPGFFDTLQNLGEKA
ncbi:MAG: 3-phosphoshikimate 1-carboxyvinyltransferase [Firmicutes bacterium]|nr:3-phosphoshikimate 1-carboxyvinyltransferase [Bacillota bacterium]